MDSTTLSQAGSQILNKNASAAILPSRPLNLSIEGSPERYHNGLDLFGTNRLRKSLKMYYYFLL